LRAAIVASRGRLMIALRVLIESTMARLAAMVRPVQFLLDAVALRASFRTRR
jgi:hypothetical protein